jgi:hypothetical protein
MNGLASFIGPSITAIFAPGGSEGTSPHFRSAGATINVLGIKAAEMCALEPEKTPRFQLDRSYTDNYELALQVAREMPYGKWRQHDAEDTVRFFALRLREAGIIKSTPQQMIARGTEAMVRSS